MEFLECDVTYVNTRACGILERNEIGSEVGRIQLAEVAAVSGDAELAFRLLDQVGAEDRMRVSFAWRYVNSNFFENLYGDPRWLEIEERAGRPVSMAAVYAALDRMQRSGHIEAQLSEPLPERGGRARKYFRLTDEGSRALGQARAAMDRMWEGIELPEDGALR